MMQINKPLMLKGLLPLASCIVLAGCTDDKYDLTDIDTTSRITVNNLTIPVNLAPIKLDDVVDLDDNENISKIEINGEEVFAIQKGGDINTSDFHINGVHVASVPVNPTDVNITVPELNIPGINLNDVNISLPDMPMQTYHINLNNVDPALISIDNVKTTTIKVEVKLSVPASVMSGNALSFKNLNIKLPWGLVTDDPNYNQADGTYQVDYLPVNANGLATLTINATGMDFLGKGTLVNNSLEISDELGIKSGDINFNLTNVNIGNFNLHADYSVSAFDLRSFSGDIDYRMDDINIDPIALNDLPDFLDNPETEIRIANPVIKVSINNPVGQYGLKGYGQIQLTSNFQGGNKTVVESDQFVIEENGANLSFATSTPGFSNVPFPGLGDILTNSSTGGLPTDIAVTLENLQFKGHAEDFPIGNIDNAQGDYEFTAPLGFASPSKVVYETTESGWNSDGLDDVNIEFINLSAECYTNLPVGVQLSVNPVDKDGNLIPVTEDSSNFKVSPYSDGEQVSIRIQGANGPIRGLDGVRFRAIISQDDPDNEGALGPDLYIELRNLRATVDGYYETDFN